MSTAAQNAVKFQMIKILEVLEVNGKKYVPLEDYQQLLGEYEKLKPKYTNAEIIADAGTDEVYDD